MTPGGFKKNCQAAGSNAWPSCYRFIGYKTIVWLLTFLGVYPPIQMDGLLLQAQTTSRHFLTIRFACASHPTLARHIAVEDWRNYWRGFANPRPQGSENVA
jgi:hypothetical protein